MPHTLHSWQLRRTYATYTYKQSHCARMYATYTLHAECTPFYNVIFLTNPLFCRCFEFPSLLLSTVVHLTRAEYHNNSYSQEKTWSNYNCTAPSNYFQTHSSYYLERSNYDYKYFYATIWYRLWYIVTSDGCRGCARVVAHVCILP